MLQNVTKTTYLLTIQSLKKYRNFGILHRLRTWYVSHNTKPKNRLSVTLHKTIITAPTFRFYFRLIKFHCRAGRKPYTPHSVDLMEWTE